VEGFEDWGPFADFLRALAASGSLHPSLIPIMDVPKLPRLTVHRGECNVDVCPSRLDQHVNWKVKSLIQRCCAALPLASEPVYYAIQRRFGSLRRAPDPRVLLRGVATPEETLRRNGRSFEDQRVLEIGTGQRLDMPIGFYLLDAKSVATVDLHRYLRPELVMESLEQVRGNRQLVRSVFEAVSPGIDFDDRLDRICFVSTMDELTSLIRLDYRAPADARNVDLPPSSVNLHVSYPVFEHIPEAVLESILRESSRLLGADGLALHHVDLSDHFAHSDPELSMIHFLRYPEEQWRRYNDNHFAYCNRLRVNEYDRIYERAGHSIVDRTTFVHPECRKSLDAEFPLAPEFAKMPKDVVVTTAARYLSKRLEGC
jgi:hypothetical protein